MDKITKWFAREKKILLSSVLCGFALSVFMGLYTMHYSDRTVEAISSQVVRFHVLPNSNSDADQALKMTVKEEVLQRYRDTLSESTSVNEAREFLSSNLSEIEAFAQNIVHMQGFDHAVSVSLAQSSFPTKKYGNIALPSGRYEALRIDIGESNGANWWCVMFPPLCFVDVTRGEIQDYDKEMLKEVLSESEFALLDNETRESNPQVMVRFRIVEWWQDNRVERDNLILAMDDTLGS